MEPTRLTAIATHGAMPTRQPNQKGSAVVEVRPGGFSCSWSQPNRIIATLAPATAITALIDVIPKQKLIRMTITVALKEYSTHRKRLMPRCRSRS